MVQDIGTQPTDDNRRTVQCMTISGTEVLAGASASARNTISSTEKVIRVSTLGDIYFAIGSNAVAVTGSSTLIPGGSTEYFKIGSNEQIAAIGADVWVSTMR